MSDDMTPVEQAPPPPEPVPAEPAAAPGGMPPAAPASAPRRHLGAVWWGIVLIGIGAALLANQFVPGVQLWRYWPIIVIAVGIRGMFGSSTGHWSLKVAAEGLVVVAIGLVFLGQTLGYLAWDVWFNIFRLWPVLIVSLGLEIIGNGMRADWLRALSSLVVVAALAYGALVMSSGAGWPPVFFTGSGDSEPFSMSTAHDPDVTEGTALVKAGVSEFSLAAGDELATADGRSSLELGYDVESDGRAADVTVGLEGSNVGFTSDSTLDVTLDREVVWDLEVKTGVSSFDVDLSEIMLSSLTFEAGVSEGTVTLGDSADSAEDGAVEAAIKGGVSTLTVRVPRGDDVRVAVQTGLTALDFRGDWDRVDDGGRRIHESADFSDRDTYWDIELDGGIGTITVEYY